MYWLQKNILLAALSWSTFSTLSASIDSPASERTKVDLEERVRSRVAPLISKYCEDACQLISVRVSLTEQIPENADIGFEGLDPQKVEASYSPERIFLEVQIDRQVSEQNRQRLYDILMENTKEFGPTELRFKPVELPNIGKFAPDSIRKEIETAVRSSIAESIREYCPDACILSYIVVDGKSISAEEASVLPPLEVYKSSSSNSYFHTSSVHVVLAVDDGISDEGRQQLLNVMKARTNFVRPVQIEFDISSFPETFTQKTERLRAESQDPYGLDKLRHLLTLFRDLAGTKEIISNSKESSSLNEKSSSNLTMSKEERLREERQEKVKEEREQRERQEASTLNNAGDESNRWFVYVIAVIAVIGIIAFLVARFSSAKKDAQFMITAMDGRAINGASAVEGVEEGGEYAGAEAKPRSPVGRTSLTARLDQLKDDLSQIFLNSPKVARETFARMILEDGVEEAAKYLHILGKMTVYELLDDPTMQRSLFELSDYFHRSDLQFSESEQEQLLLRLKTKVTANEIRVMTQKTIDQFDFLTKMDPAQVFALIQDESSRVQSIVLTQLNPTQRQGVFRAFDGDARTRLLKELCRADAIPREYLGNVAQALNKKASSKPEFDTQNVRASDVLLSFLERSTLSEQKALMSNMRTSNPDTNRTLKMRLVTIEILPYLKTGHLLELVLGLDRDDLLTFLAGTRDHIRELLLSHAPQELAESWVEDLEGINGIEEKRYQSVEHTILNRVRNMASEGIISLMDINNMIFPDDEVEEDKTKQFSIAPTNFVA